MKNLNCADCWVVKLKRVSAIQTFTNGDVMKEIWKPIILDDIQERYAVSNFGRVIDLKNQKYMIWHDNGAGC